MMAPVVTFYSYKGGVGRTQALANIAVRLANRGKNVILVDMDLESPGVHAFFSPPDDESRTFQERDFAERPGMVDYLERCSTSPPEEPSIEGMLVTCSHRFLRRDAGSIRLLPPGRLDPTYIERLAAFSWERFYSEQHGYAYMELMRRQLCGLADIVLVDSRTGLTDAGMVCTFQLPDTIVVLFALHQQGIEGAERMAKAIAQRRHEAPGSDRARRILLVPSRVDDAAELDRANHFLREARKHLGAIAGCELLDGRTDRIPYVAFFAYGENVVDPGEDNRLSAAYENLMERIEGSLSGPSRGEARKPRDEAPLLATLTRECALLQREAMDLSRAASVPLEPREPLERLARHASDILYRQTEALRRISAANEILHSLAVSMEDGTGSAELPIPTSLADWERFPQTAEEIISGTRFHLFAYVQQRIRTAASGDDTFLEARWHDIQKRLEEATASDLPARIASFEAEARRSTLDAQIQRAALRFEALAARYRTAKERALWLDERIQRLMDQGELTAESAGQLANLLVLRVMDRLEEPLAPSHWSSYDVLCMLVADRAEQSDAAFREVGFALWSDAWARFFEAGSMSLFSAAGVECQRQLERVATVAALVAPLIEMIAVRLGEAWTGGDSSRERVLRLFAERRGDPCLRGALSHLAGRRGDLPDLHAAWLMDLAPFDGDEFRGPLRTVLDHLAKNGRAGEAYYGFLAVAPRARCVEDDRSFFFVHAALVEALAGDPERAGALEQLFYDREFCDRLGATPHGAALLAILGCGLEHHERPTPLRTAARVVFQQQVTIALPQDLLPLMTQPVFSDPAYARAALEVAVLLSSVRNEGERPVHSTWHLRTSYENELKKFFAEELHRIRVQSIGTFSALSLAISADDWMDMAARIVGRGHQGDAPDGPARNKIRQIFEQSNEMLAQLSRVLGRVAARGITVAQVESDASVVRQACEAMSIWLTSAGEPHWLSKRVQNLWEVQL